jgi:hypothetical protein
MARIATGAQMHNIVRSLVTEPTLADWKEM